MKTNILFFIGGVLVGFIIYLSISKVKQQTKYVQLLEDYDIEDIGHLKKGVKLKIDEAMPEGFTRYILYLNLKGGNTKLLREEPDKVGLIIPYWLREQDSIL